MKNIINLVVEEELHGKRIDLVIAKKNDFLSRTRVKNLIINGNLSINNKIIKFNMLINNWCACKESNPEPPEPKSGALSS